MAKTSRETLAKVVVVYKSRAAKRVRIALGVVVAALLFHSYLTDENRLAMWEATTQTSIFKDQVCTPLRKKANLLAENQLAAAVGRALAKDQVEWQAQSDRTEKAARLVADVLLEMESKGCERPLLEPPYWTGD
jgi:hypothetical protein